MAVSDSRRFGQKRKYDIRRPFILDQGNQYMWMGLVSNMEKSLLLWSTVGSFTLSALLGGAMAVLLMRLSTIVLLLACLCAYLMASKLQKINSGQPKHGGIREFFVDAKARGDFDGLFLVLCGSLVALIHIAVGGGLGALIVYAAKFIYR